MNLLGEQIWTVMESTKTRSHPRGIRRRDSVPMVSLNRVDITAKVLIFFLRDLQAYKKGEVEMEPLTVFKGHSSVVGDVAWHNLQEHIFASVGDDRMMLVCVSLPTRKGAQLTMTSTQLGHSREPQCTQE
jgi:hypothetical protein